MFDTNERRLLTRLLKQLGRPDPRFLAGRWSTLAVWFVLVLVFTLLFQVAQRYQISPVALVVASAVMGSVTAWVLIYSFSIRQWPCIRKHLNEQSIRARLSELDAD